MFGAISRRILQSKHKLQVQRYSAVINVNINRNYPSNDTNIVHSPSPDIKFNNSTLQDYVFRDFGKYPDKIAVECALTGKKYTYEELRRNSKNFGKALHKKFKLRKGDVIALLLPNIPDFAICLLGALEAAVTVTTINPLYTPEEIKRQLVDSDAKLLITMGQLWPTAQATVKLMPTSNAVPIVTIKMMESEALPQGSVHYHELVDANYDNVITDRLEMDDIAMMPYSSGTTGVPKGVELTNGNLLANIQQMDDPYIKFGDVTTDTNQDVVPGIIPWFHIYGLVGVLLNNLSIMSKLVSLPKFSPELYTNLLDKYKPNILLIVPPLVLFMSNNPMIQKKHLQSIHTICSGAAPLGTLDEEKLQNKAEKQINIVQGYGLTETCSCLFVMSPRTKKKLKVTGSIGEPVANTSVKIVSTEELSGEALGPHKCGELLARGPQVFPRYRNNPQASKEAIVDGWFRTGDVAYYDDNKVFYITDRLKELIKVKGFQVAPAELEEIIRNYPSVSDVAVIGVPHDVYGEVPRAYIVPKPNDNVEGSKVQEYVASKVSNFKQLRGGVIMVQSIPKTASGKILKKDLKLLT